MNVGQQPLLNAVLLSVACKKGIDKEICFSNTLYSFCKMHKS